jgi:hypothetical protein
MNLFNDYFKEQGHPEGVVCCLCAWWEGTVRADGYCHGLPSILHQGKDGALIKKATSWCACFRHRDTRQDAIETHSEYMK